MSFSAPNELADWDLYRTVLTAPISLILCTTIIGLSLHSGVAFRVLDQPNDRSLHVTPKPRVGGIAIVFASAVVYVATDGSTFWPVVAAMLALSAISFCDDIWSLPARVRFGAHFLAAVGVAVLYPVSPIWIAAPLTLAVMWATNLFNFMDGMDGLSGGMAVAGFGAYALVAWSGHNTTISVLSETVASAAAGFLIFNFPPSRVFMGDGGAVPLGFLAAALGYLGFRNGIWPWWFGPLVFSPFLMDATITLFRRILRGDRFWEAHRSHYYQRMAQAGYGHFGTTIRWYALMVAVDLTAVCLVNRPGRIVAATLLAWAIVYVLLMLWVDRLWARQSAPVSGEPSPPPRDV